MLYRCLLRMSSSDCKMHFGWLFCHCLVLRFHPMKSIFIFINPFILHEQPAWWIISNSYLVCILHHRLTFSSQSTYSKLLWYTAMPCSHPHSLSSPCSFQTFAWNPGVLACLIANLQPVVLPSAQLSIQVSLHSSSSQHCPYSSSQPMKALPLWT